MSELAARRVRLKADPWAYGDLFDVGATPNRKLRIPRGNTVQLEVGCFFGETPMDISNLASITLEIRDAATHLTILASTTITPSDPSWDDVIALADFTAGTAENFIIELTDAQMNQTATVDGTTYWLVISAISADSPAKPITLGAGNFVIWQDGAGEGSLPAPPDDVLVLTSDQSDARYMLRVPAASNWRVNPSTEMLEMWDLGTSAWRAVWLNNGVLVTP